MVSTSLRAHHAPVAAVEAISHLRGGVERFEARFVGVGCNTDIGKEAIDTANGADLVPLDCGSECDIDGASSEVDSISDHALRFSDYFPSGLDDAAGIGDEGDNAADVVPTLLADTSDVDRAVVTHL